MQVKKKEDVEETLKLLFSTHHLVLMLQNKDKELVRKTRSLLSSLGEEEGLVLKEFLFKDVKLPKEGVSEQEFDEAVSLHGLAFDVPV